MVELPVAVAPPLPALPAAAAVSEITAPLHAANDAVNEARRSTFLIHRGYSDAGAGAIAACAALPRSPFSVDPARSPGHPFPMKHKQHKRRIAGSIAALVSAAGLVIAGACGGTGEGDTSLFTGSESTGSHGSGSSGIGGDIGITAGNGNGNGNGSGSGSGGAGCGQAIQGIIRDFSPTTNPDFEGVLGDDKGIVMTDLGADGKPVYAGNPTTLTTHGKTYFDQWYRDTMGSNIAIPFSFMLSPGGGNIYTYDNQAFFPIDGQGFKNEGNAHNYHFTLEVHTQFPYIGGEVFTFTGDDDLFTFINGKLAIDIGGVHGAETGSVDLDKAAAQLGITKGNTYKLDMFFAERHTVDSHFRIDTTIGCFSSPPPPK